MLLDESTSLGLNLRFAQAAALSSSLLVASGGAGSAFAAALPSTFVQTQIQLNTPFADPFSAMPVTTNSGPSTVSDSLSAPLEDGQCRIYACSASADGSARATASFGTLGAYASGDGFAGNGGSANAFVTAQSSWTDFITATSSAIPNGTMVPLKVTVALEGETVLHKSLGNGAIAAVLDSGLFTFTGDAPSPGNETLVVYLCATTDPSSNITPPDCDAALANVFLSSETSSTADLVVGQTLGFSGGFTVVSSASVSTLGLDTVSATADGSNTSRIYLEPLADFSLTTASGHDYTRPVPEQSSLALGAISLVALWLLHRRNSGSHRCRPNDDLPVGEHAWRSG
jgi:hypothetical protein